ncbi:hypothetical protein CPB85DRAFT_979633 [Mucidula mucida]|nr:hypothetical protein CPB85DRAFT_979633 [Mucidula mucida]
MVAPLVFMQCTNHSALIKTHCSVSRDSRKNRTRGLCIWMLTIMHLLATAHLAARWNFVREAFIVHGATAESTYDYLSTSPRWMLTSSVAFSSNTLIADCILIWRCWIIWGTRWVVVAFPMFCTVVGTIFAIFSIYQQATTPPPGSAWSEAQIDWGVPYFSMSLTVTVLCTILIIYRVVTVRGDTNSLGVTTAYRVVSYNAVIEIVVESAALYSISLCIWMAYYVKGVPEGNYPLVILTTATVSLTRSLC